MLIQPADQDKFFPWLNARQIPYALLRGREILRLPPRLSAGDDIDLLFVRHLADKSILSCFKDNW